MDPVHRDEIAELRKELEYERLTFATLRKKYRTNKCYDDTLFNHGKVRGLEIAIQKLDGILAN